MITLLFLSASPRDQTPLAILREEIKRIKESVRQSKHRDEIRIEQGHAVTPRELSDYLLEYAPHIVHFSGHGSSKGALIFEDSDGMSKEVSPSALSELFRIVNSDPRKKEEGKVKCVVLSACFSAKQADAISKHVDFVIGTMREISDESATIFAEGFYRGIGDNMDLQRAFDLGLNQLALDKQAEHRIFKSQVRKNPHTDPSKIYLLAKEEGDDRNELVKKGDRCLEMGKDEEAMGYFDKALELNLEDDDAWNGKGNALLYLKRYDDAIDAFDKAAKINPKNARTWNNLGRALRYGPLRFHDAIDAFDKAIELDPTYAAPWINKANSLTQLWRFDEAIQVADKAIEIDSDYLEAWVEKVSALESLHKYKTALSVYDNALKTHSSSRDLKQWRESTLEKLKQAEQDVQDADKHLENDPKDFGALSKKVSALLMLERYEEVPAAADKIFEAYPESKEYSVLHSKGRALLELQRYEEAMQVLDKYESLEFREHFALYEKGRVQLKLGKLTEAKSLFEKGYKSHHGYE